MGIISSLYIDNCVTPNGKLDEQQRRLSRGRLTSISSNKGQGEVIFWSNWGHFSSEHLRHCRYTS